MIFQTAVCPTYVGMNRQMASVALLGHAYAPRMWG